MALFKEAVGMDHYWRVEWGVNTPQNTTRRTRKYAREIKQYLKERGVKSTIFKVYRVHDEWISEKVY